MTGAAERQARYRARRRADRAVLVLEIDDLAGVTAWLIDAGLLNPANQDDRRQVAEALAEATHLSVREWIYASNA